MPLKLPRIVLLAWLIASPITLIAGLFTYTTLTGNSIGSVLGTSTGQEDLFSSPPPQLGGIGQSLTTGDARPYLLNNFLAEYNSPFKNKGSYIVQMADKYGIDWRLVTAIAFQESALGRVLPAGSNNAWGWGIYTGKDSGAVFHSWEFAIQTVTAGIAKDYYARGLRTPQQIMTKYSPSSNGSWANSVQETMDAIQQ